MPKVKLELPPNTDTISTVFVYISDPQNTSVIFDWQSHKAEVVVVI